MRVPRDGIRTLEDCEAFEGNGLSQWPREEEAMGKTVRGRRVILAVSVLVAGAPAMGVEAAPPCVWVEVRAPQTGTRTLEGCARPSASGRNAASVSHGRSIGQYSVGIGLLVPLPR